MSTPGERFRPRAARRRGRRTPGVTFATSAALALIFGVLVLVFMLQLAGNGTVRSHLGSQVFDAGRAGSLAGGIGSSGPRSGPLLFQALVGRHDIYLQHLGGDPNAGWSAFDAHAPDEDRTCVLSWDTAARVFHDPCRARSFPADGAGLVHYPVTVNAAHHVIVDLRRPQAPAG